jgi:hypothetical protein
MWETNEEKIAKLKSLDKAQYGHFGFESRFGYVPISYCIDMCKLLNQGWNPGSISTKFNLSLTDTLTILTYWSSFTKKGDDMNDIKCFGGSEYSEIQKWKEKPPFKHEDLDEIFMDIAEFEKLKEKKGDSDESGIKSK